MLTMEDRSSHYDGKAVLLHVREVERFTTDELARWMANVLRDEEETIRRSEFESQSYLLHRYYESFPPDGKLFFQEALLANLRDLAENPNSSLIGEGGDALLLLVANIFHEIPDASAQGIFSNKTEKSRLIAIENLLGIIAQERFRNVSVEQVPGIKINHHWRAVQALVGLGYPTSPEFWSGLVEKYGDEYAPLAFSGMWKLHFQEAIDWLEENVHRPQAVEGFFNALPLMVERRGQQEIAQVVNKISPQLLPNHQADLVKIKRLLKL